MLHDENFSSSEEEEIDYPDEHDLLISDSESESESDIEMTTPLLLSHPEAYFECCICCTYTNSVVDPRTSLPYTLERIPDDVDAQDVNIIASPCNKHWTCTRCLKHYALQGHLSCPYPYEAKGCRNALGREITFSVDPFQNIMRPEQFRDFLEVLRRKRVVMSTPTDDRNHYVRADTPPFLYKHEEVPANVVAQRVSFIRESDTLPIPCTQCGVMMHKTTQCNALKHCGVERCWICGRIDIPSIDTDHWKQCPRFDTDVRWKSIAPHYVCKEGECYSDEYDCVMKAHEQGRREVLEYRRHRQLTALLNSIQNVSPI